MLALVVIGIVVLLALAAWRLRRGFVTFRERFRTYLADHPDIEWRQDTSNGVVCTVSGVPLEVDLLETYVFHLRRHRREREMFEQLADALRHRVPPVVPPPFPLVQDRVLPLIKREQDILLSRGYRRQHVAARSPCVDDLVVAYVIEGPFQMTYVTEGMRSAWGIGVADLHRLAVANLRTKTRHLLDELGAPQADYIALDGYDAARALVADLLIPPQIDSPILAIPHEHACLIADAGTADALATRAAAMYRAAELPLTPRLFTVSPDGLVPFERPGATTGASEGLPQGTD